MAGQAGRIDIFDHIMVPSLGRDEAMLAGIIESVV